jgi:hypothetical protein
MSNLLTLDKEGDDVLFNHTRGLTTPTHASDIKSARSPQEDLYSKWL